MKNANHDKSIGSMMKQIATKESPLPATKRCPTCGGTMFLHTFVGFRRYFCHACIETEKREKQREEQRKELRDRRHALRRAMAIRLERVIPPHFRHARLGRVPVNIREGLAKRGREQSLFLWGRTGVGKSYTVAAMVRDMIVRTRGGVLVAGTTHAELDQALRASFARDSGITELGVLKPFLEADVLWLEDIGAGVTPSDFTQRTLEILINKRIQEERVTIITSNLTRAQIQDAYGPRIGSRLKTYMIVRIVGKDRRESR